MKKLIIIAIALLIGSLMLMNITAASAAEGKGKMETATGKVMSIDPQGKAITISTKAAEEAMDVGVIVNDETVIKVKGKKAALSDIKAGDTVKIKYLRSNDLYAKEIEKK